MSNDSTKISDTVEKGFFRASAADFKKIPGSPIAYWVSENFLTTFNHNKCIQDVASLKAGMSTGDNPTFQRYWYEVILQKIQFDCIGYDHSLNNIRWFPCNSGGQFRKWYGNNETVVDWENNGQRIKNHRSSAVRNVEYYFKSGLTYSKISSGKFAARQKLTGFLFDDTGRAISVEDNKDTLVVLALLCSEVAHQYLAVLAPSMSFTSAEIGKIPLLEFVPTSINENSKTSVEISKQDWDSYETSWDFSDLPLLNNQTVGRVSDSVTRQLDDVGLRDKAANPTYTLPLSIKETYTQLRAHWQEMTLETQRLEEENNRIFIDAYGLQDELTSDVSLKEITLTCNPYYRYGKEPRIDTNEHEKKPTDIRVNPCSLVVQKSFPKDTELEERLLADTLKEFISYAVGCMFGRYALDKPGLILANQGETIEDYYKKLQEPRIDTNKHEKNQTNISVNSCSFVVQKSDVLFPADDDNVIPMLDGDWFTDDVTERFGQFLKVTFGDVHYEENLKFIEQALGKDIRKYFLKDFYPDHLKRYKKRPIYWLFSSPKGTFNALIYMHRYRPDTVSVVLNDYLREFRTKLSAHKNHLEAVSISSNASAGEKTKALKDIENHSKMIDELNVYEREVLYPLATEQIEIDLDDGVKVNYQKFGEALKKIPGLAAKEG